MNCDMSLGSLDFLLLDNGFGCSSMSWSNDDDGIDLTSQLIPTSKSSSPVYMSPYSIDYQSRYGQRKSIADVLEPARFARELVKVNQNNTTISSQTASSLLPMVLFVYGLEADSQEEFFKIIKPEFLSRDDAQICGYEDSYLSGFNLKYDNDDWTYHLEHHPVKQVPPSIIRGRVYILTKPAHLVCFNEYAMAKNMGVLTRTEEIVTRVNLAVGTGKQLWYRVLETRKSGFTYAKHLVSAANSDIEVEIPALVS